MLNLRNIDGKFNLSGGWVDVPEDVKWLSSAGFVAVLDLQFTKLLSSAEDFRIQSKFIGDTCLSKGIDYQAIQMNDGFNSNLGEIFNAAYQHLDIWDKLFVGKRDRILIKCGVGVSRSPSILIYYYCRRDNISFKEARDRISSTDWQITNMGLPIYISQEFEMWLKERFPDDPSVFGEVEV